MEPQVSGEAVKPDEGDAQQKRDFMLVLSVGLIVVVFVVAVLVVIYVSQAR